MVRRLSLIWPCDAQADGDLLIDNLEADPDLESGTCSGDVGPGADVGDARTNGNPSSSISQRGASTCILLTAGASRQKNAGGGAIA